MEKCMYLFFGGDLSKWIDRQELWRCRLLNKTWHKALWSTVSDCKPKKAVSIELLNLSQLAPNLNHLDLSDCPNVIPKHIGFLTSLQYLTSLDFRNNCKKSRVDRDQQLLKMCCELPLKMFQFSAASPDVPIHYEKIYYPPLQFWEPISKLKDLTHLSLNYIFHPNYLHLLGNLTNLEHLELKLFSSLYSVPSRYGCHEPPHNIFAIHSRNTKVDPSSYTFTHLANLTNLSTLATDIPEGFDLNSISRLTSLQNLSVCCDPSLTSLATAVSPLTRLISLACPETLDLPQLTPLAHLTRLDCVLPTGCLEDCILGLTSLQSLVQLGLCIDHCSDMALGPLELATAILPLTNLQVLVFRSYWSVSEPRGGDVLKTKFPFQVKQELRYTPDNWIGGEERNCRYCNYPETECECG